VDNGGEDEDDWTVAPTRDRAEIVKALRQTDEEHIYAFMPNSKKAFGWVYLVYGNCGYDTVNDYTTNLEASAGVAGSKFYDEHEGGPKQ
jgi:hypothetical protein